MQITGQLFTGLFLGIDHTFPLIHNILVKACILDGNHGLTAKNIENFAPVRRKKARLWMAEEQDPVGAEATAQGETINLFTPLEGNKMDQFGIISNIF